MKDRMTKIIEILIIVLTPPMKIELLENQLIMILI